MLVGLGDDVSESQLATQLRRCSIAEANISILRVRFCGMRYRRQVVVLLGHGRDIHADMVT